MPEMTPEPISPLPDGPFAALYLAPDGLVYTDPDGDTMRIFEESGIVMIAIKRKGEGDDEFRAVGLNAEGSAEVTRQLIRLTTMAAVNKQANRN